MAGKEKKGVRLDHISKIYNDPKTGKQFYAVNDVSLEIKPGSFVTLLGPSGCGKTTTLRIIGGFETADSGEVFFDGKRINDVPPYKRNINTVFQKYALFPHLNVFENVAFGLRIGKTVEENGKKKKVKIPEAEIEQRVMEMLEVVSLKGFENRRINELSGGQQQRVAIARALVNNPSTIIADEPTGNLDPARSLEIMSLLQEINNLGTTMLVVTHAQNLVESFNKRVIAIDEGVVISDGMDGYYRYENQ